MEALNPRDDRTALEQAFLLFEQASAQLQEEYAGLRGEVARLRREVEEKNALLSRGIEEHRRWMLFLATVLERIPNGIVVTNPDGGILASNGHAERLLGLSGPPEPGTPLSSLGETGLAVARAAEAGATRTVTSGRRKGEPLRLKVARTALPEAGGASGGSLLVLEDETDAHLLSEGSERARRLASMGEMAARIAHEIRNPLTSCRLFLAMAVQDAQSGKGEDALANLGKLEGVLGSIDCAVSNMLGFIRNHRPACLPFDPEALARECVEYARPLLQERGIETVVENLAPGETAISDPTLLRQAFLNILLNAIQAMGPGGGSVAVRISHRPVRKGEGEAPYLRFSFRDTGPGIPESILPRIFDPFFTTRSDGTGLGLTVVQSIMLALDGFAEVESVEGGGTTFSLLVPRDPRYGKGQG
ncbi:MAG: PAS domain-containing protein [Deltaproteobacteria bacterium]|nr:PAS domain-containing protein [Deltaproteobacteria bacterium]